MIFAEDKVLNFLKTKKIALFIVAYNAEQHIQKTIERIPKDIIDSLAEIYVIDDSSSDKTVEKAKAMFKKLGVKITG